MKYAGSVRARQAVATVVATAAMAVAPPATALSDPEAELHSLQHVRASASVNSPDGRFERGCQSHGYRYRVRAGGSDWSLELFLVDARGRQVATGYEWKGADPRRGRGRFEFCSQATRPGKFTVRSRLTWDDGQYHEKRLKRRTIWLRR